jgi:hypothetical protein
MSCKLLRLSSFRYIYICSLWLTILESSRHQLLLAGRFFCWSWLWNCNAAHVKPIDIVLTHNVRARNDIVDSAWIDQAVYFCPTLYIHLANSPALSTWIVERELFGELISQEVHQIFVHSLQGNFCWVVHLLRAFYSGYVVQTTLHYAK